jgi:helicase MOV-10
MKTTQYQAGSEYVVELCKNYRSHPSILQFSNEKFYANKLQAKAPADHVNFALQWNILAKQGFPLILENLETKCELNGEMSSYNLGQIKSVKEYVEKLKSQKIGSRPVTNDDIGIMTPYTAQVEKLTDEFKNVCFKGLEIGTIEHFQGREKNIIILSTVKTGNSLGFLTDDRRINVAMTVAKGLLVVIMNVRTMQQDGLWNHFIEYCRKNDACRGLKSASQIAKEIVSVHWK